MPLIYTLRCGSRSLRLSFRINFYAPLARDFCKSSNRQTDAALGPGTRKSRHKFSAMYILRNPTRGINHLISHGGFLVFFFLFSDGAGESYRFTLLACLRARWHSKASASMRGSQAEAPIFKGKESSREETVY